MDRHDCKAKKPRTDEPDPDLMLHIRSLGLTTVADYLGWCAQHGFSRRTAKHWRVRLKERSYANRAVAEARLVQKKQEVRKPEKIIERIFNDELHEDEVTLFTRRSPKPVKASAPWYCANCLNSERAVGGFRSRQDAPFPIALNTSRGNP